jgi:hypothetical protein
MTNLSVCHTTLQKINNKESSFPLNIRESLCQAVSDIPIDDIEELFDRHESNPDNFDGRIEKNLTKLCPEANILNNHRISNLTKFNNDICIEDNNTLICLEIEKGYMSRFELDVLKMQAFASNRITDNPSADIYGAFIVPADNVVARHIAGNSNESSYKYLCKLSRLVSQIENLLLKDILIVGYSTSEITEKVNLPKTKKVKSQSSVSYVISGSPLVEVDTIEAKLRGYPLEQILNIRKCLTARFSGLHEKLNYNSRYLG